MLIELTKGMQAVIDDEDYELIRPYKWFAIPKGKTAYAIGYRHGFSTGKRVSMHAVLNPEFELTDHANGNGLDNRRVNLREATKSQNAANCRHKSTSGFRGVCWHKRRQRWTVQLKLNYRNILYAHFDAKEEAAREYDKVAKEVFGEFACLNFPEEKDS